MTSAVQSDHAICINKQFVYERSEMPVVTLLWFAVQSLEELRDFMYVDGVPSKDRQKLMRNLRVKLTTIV